MTDSPTNAELLQTVQALVKRVEALENELKRLKDIQAHDIPEDVMLAITAAVAAFLGKKARIRQIHYRTDAAWAQQGRAAIQGHVTTHSLRREQV
ncbi:hypothetical protein D3875_18680 [Deinococcus cavernae]|uniref:Uncharacterized protein n=1 Tax=Deinococcus cavernae TaxID=2320857 RepID=A0A418VB67_9DEIO|nr:hypothetical protein [Deinococcus cavernae]RJF73276.1 hypothetical protein D3875_18680 [Deinococcus cavernae]